MVLPVAKPFKSVELYSKFKGQILGLWSIGKAPNSTNTLKFYFKSNSDVKANRQPHFYNCVCVI